MKKTSTKKTQLLLIDDVDGLGRSGDIVTAKPGYIRNFLLPEKKAVVADRNTLRMREKLQKERLQRAEVDRKEGEELAARLVGFTLRTEVKVDPEGHMYGSVSGTDIARMMQEHGFHIERKNVLIPQPVKTVGRHTVQLRLKEGVLATVALEIVAEGVLDFSAQA